MSDPNQGAVIQGQLVPRSRLGVHLQLGRLLQQINRALDDKDIAVTVDLMRQYFKLCGWQADGKSGLEQLRAFLQLAELNRSLVTMAWQRATMPTDPQGKPTPYDYPGRGWAWQIHKLASRYGWSPAQVFGLWPEEAAAYLQEIMIAEYDEADERRSLSELAYHYDKNSKKSTFRPIPRPSWMKDDTSGQPKLRRVRRDMLPIGNIINLTNKTNEDFEFIQ